MLFTFLDGEFAGMTFSVDEVGGGGGGGGIIGIAAALGIGIIVVAFPLLIWPVLVMQATHDPSDGWLLWTFVVEALWMVCRVCRGRAAGGTSVLAEIALNTVFLFVVLVVAIALAFGWACWFCPDVAVRELLVANADEIVAEMGRSFGEQLPMIVAILASLSVIPSFVVKALAG